MPVERTLQIPESSLNTVSAALLLAQQAIESLRKHEPVRVDLTRAERMTSSFANALVMTILDAVGEQVFQSSVTLDTPSALVRESWDKAVERYRRGIRLTTQQSGAA
jgi:hypothetical protein